MELNEEIQKKIIEIRMLEDQIGQMEERVRLIDREILELQNIILSLDELTDVDDKEAMVPIGKNVFVKSKVNNCNEVYVNIGSKTIVKKTIIEAKKLFEEKKDKFLEAREYIGTDADKIIKRIGKVDSEIMDIQNKINIKQNAEK